MRISSKRALAKELGVSDALVTKLVHKGMPYNVDGTFDLEEVQAWRQARKERALVCIKDRQIINVDQFKRERADIYAFEEAEDIKTQQIIRDEMRDKLKRNELGEPAMRDWYDILGKDEKRKHDQERLERGESTENVAVMIGLIRESKKRRERASGGDG